MTTVTAVFTAYLNWGNAWTMHFVWLLDVSACGVVFTNFCTTLHVLKSFWSIWRRTRHVFEVKFVFTISRCFCWIDDEIAEITACMHSFASQETSSTESFQGDKKSQTTCMYPLCCVVEKSRWHVCRGFACFGFLLPADANTADRTLCKYL